jgi:hypothetical protein
MKHALTRIVSKVLTAGPGGEAGRKEGVKWAVGGMATLLSGQKLAALTMFARGFGQLERGWRERHPEFQGDFKARVDAAITFYEATHQNPVNRQLHLVGIPMIVGGAVGLIASPSFSPPWIASAGAFTAGWALNIVGHAAFEKNAPAFADDPLSFIVGPIWDARQMLARGKDLLGRPKAATAAA